jgi:hypothetical protein
MTIKNCIFTKSDSIILKPWILRTNDIHTGIDISGDTIYSPCFGIIVSVLYNNAEKYAIVIQYNADTCIRVSNLISTDIKLGDSIKLGDKIGYSDKYAHIEYLLSTISTTPALCIRVGSYTYYKYDPIDIITGSITFPMSGASELTIIKPTTMLPHIDAIPSEFRGN